MTPNQTILALGEKLLTEGLPVSLTLDGPHGIAEPMPRLALVAYCFSYLDISVFQAQAIVAAAIEDLDVTLVTELAEDLVRFKLSAASEEVHA